MDSVYLKFLFLFLTRPEFSKIHDKEGRDPFRRMC